MLFPLREIFPSLLRRDHPFFHGATQVYLSDARDHLLRILDVLDAQRDMAAGALEASLAVSSHRLNKTMKTLALLTGAVAVMGAVFGAYGMNFQAVPLAEYRWGFWLDLGRDDRVRRGAGPRRPLAEVVVSACAEGAPEGTS